MSTWKKVRGFVGSFPALFQLGKGGPNLKNNAAVLEARNAADSDFARASGADPTIPDNFATKRYVDASVGIAVDTSLMPASGLLAFLSSGAQALPADSLSAQSSQVVGLFTGTLNRLATSGTQSIQCTAAGGRPAVGAPVYLAAFTDDLNTGRGKGTATAPNIAKLVTTPTSLSGTPPRNPVTVGICKSTALYVDGVGGPVDVELDLPLRLAPYPPPDTQFFSTAYDGFSATKFLTMPGNTPELGLPNNSAFLVIFNHVIPQVVNEVVWGNLDAGFTKGLLFYAATQLRAYIFTTGPTLAVDSHFGMNPGLHCAMVSNKDGVVTLVHGIIGENPLQGAQLSITTGALVNQVFADVTCTATLGGGVAGTAPLGGQAICLATFLNNPFSVPDMCTVVRNILAPDGGGDRYRPTQDVINQAQFFWHADEGTTAINGNNGLATFSWTPHGGLLPTGSFFQEQLYEQPANYFFGAGRVDLSALNIPEPDTMITEIEWQANASNNSFMLTFQTPEVFNFDELTIGAFVDGALIAEPVYGGDGAPHSIWFGYQGTTATAHVVRLQTSSLAQRYATASGSYLVRFQGPANAVFTTYVPGQKRFVFAAADEATGVDAGILSHQSPTNGMLAAVLRAGYPTAGNGTFVCNAAMGRELFNVIEQFGSGSAQPFADQLLAAGRKGSPGSVVVAVFIGFRDYQGGGIPGLTYATPTAYAAAMGQLFDALHAAEPTWPLYLFELINVLAVSPNPGGFTIAQYNAALVAMAASRVWLLIRDVSGPTPITFQPAGAAPNTFPDGPGILALKANIAAAMGADY